MLYLLKYLQEAVLILSPRNVEKLDTCVMFADACVWVHPDPPYEHADLSHVNLWSRPLTSVNVVQSSSLTYVAGRS